MPQSPQRPYVPHRTPTRAQPSISAADFTLAKPFVPDLEQATNASFEPADAAPLSGAESVASIESFLAEAVGDPLSSSADPYDDLGDEEELPPLEHFLDPLPAIADFAPLPPVDEGETPDQLNDAIAADASRDEADTDWIETDWQRYDWQSVAALGDTERAHAEASNAWATTDWEVPPPRQSARAANASDAIATALDQIAERIRKGDLSVPGAGGVADPATIAATLAALLGVRR